jgi:lipopolysaccharide/colanic/teichoic acid biosynthesis glycosyltransferase
MKETSLALQTEQTTKGGSLPWRRDPFRIWKRVLPSRRRKWSVRSEGTASPSDCAAEIPASNVVSILQWAVFQRFCTERGLNQGPDFQFDGLRLHKSSENSTNGSAPHGSEHASATTACQSDSALLNVRPPLWKRIVDLGILACTVWIWLPLAMLVLCLVKLASPGPAIYRQGRVGYRGRCFMIFKFRTMRVNAETRTHEQYLEQLMSSDSPMIKLDASDPRVVPFGRFLRATGLDELPQIFNVIRGEMSLVGPRPCTAVEFQCYRPEQRDRVDAFPGITGLWQVNGKNKTTFNEMIAMDIHYARNMSLWLDLWIIAKTLPAIASQCLQTLAARPPKPATSSAVLPRKI